MTAIYGRRCFQMRLTYRQLAIMLDHPDSPLIPAVGLLYPRETRLRGQTLTAWVLRRGGSVAAINTNWESHIICV